MSCLGRAAEVYGRYTVVQRAQWHTSAGTTRQVAVKRLQHHLTKEHLQVGGSVTGRGLDVCRGSVRCVTAGASVLCIATTLPFFVNMFARTDILFGHFHNHLEFQSKCW